MMRPVDLPVAPPPRPIDQPVGAWPRPVPPRVDPPVGSWGPRPGYKHAHGNYGAWIPDPNAPAPVSPGIDPPVGAWPRPVVAPDHPAAMLQQAATAHAQQFRNQMARVAPLIADPNFHALLAEPVSLQNHSAAYEYFHQLAQRHGFPDVQTLMQALIRHQAQSA